MRALKSKESFSCFLKKIYPPPRPHSCQIHPFFKDTSKSRFIYLFVCTLCEKHHCHSMSMSSHLLRVTYDLFVSFISIKNYLILKTFKTFFSFPSLTNSWRLCGGLVSTNLWLCRSPGQELLQTPGGRGGDSSRLTSSSHLWCEPWDRLGHSMLNESEGSWRIVILIEICLWFNL